MGVFIYKTSGDLGKSNFVVKAVDILLMAKGSSAEVGYVTDIEMFKDLAALGLEEHQRGLIHSHNKMGTSFSGTDTNQLLLCAENNPYYLSVVVNNEFNFTAKIAIKNTIETKGFKWFKDLKNRVIKTPITQTEHVYDIYELQVVLDKPDYMKEVDARIAKKLQFYSNQTGGQGGVGGNNNYSKKGADSPDPVATKRVQQPTKTNNNIQQEFDYLGEFNDFIKAVLDKYCKPAGHFLAPDECAYNILQDKDDTGIPVIDFIHYLKLHNYSGIEHDKLIIDELEKTIIRV